MVTELNAGEGNPTVMAETVAPHVIARCNGTEKRR